ncbi:uncharacterized protein TNCV_2033431 [Trichonephila clavipes]|nr:uncharacterized protein TNCV_2033431 [Trichonephila clavipes]
MLSDSRSSIQHLSEWWRHDDRRTTSIVQLLNSLSANVKIYFQRVPSHMNVCGNQITDGFVHEGSHEYSTLSGCLTFSEIATRVKRLSVPLGSRALYMSSMKETILMMLCLVQAVGEMKLLLLSVALDIFQLNGIWRVLKFTLPFLIPMRPKSLLPTSWLVLVAIRTSCCQVILQFFIV